MYKNSLGPYSLMHIIAFLAEVVLHRAYLRFVGMDEPCQMNMQMQMHGNVRGATTNVNVNAAAAAAAPAPLPVPEPGLGLGPGMVKFEESTSGENNSRYYGSNSGPGSGAGTPMPPPLGGATTTATATATATTPPVSSTAANAAPEGFWRDVAREAFRASRHLMELVKTCHDRAVLTETPLVGFAVYNAALMGVYAAHFPHVDVDGCLSSSSVAAAAASSSSFPVSSMSDGGGNNEGVTATAGAAGDGLGSQGQAETRRALEILAGMRARLPMAVGWFRTVQRVHSYYLRARWEVERVMGNNVVSARNGDEVRLLEKVFADLGCVEDRFQVPAPQQSVDVSTSVNAGAVQENVEDVAAVNGTTSTTITTGEHGSDTASNHVQSEAGEATTDTTHPTTVAEHGRREAWVPINNSSNGHSNTSNAGAEGIETTPRDVEQRREGNVLRPLENLDPRNNNIADQQQPSFSLPSITTNRPASQPHTPSSTPTPPFTSTSMPMSMSMSMALPPPSSQPPPPQQPSNYHSPTNSSNNTNSRPQPLQPWPCASVPPGTAHSRSLPSLNASQQGFPFLHLAAPHSQQYPGPYSHAPPPPLQVPAHMYHPNTNNGNANASGNGVVGSGMTVNNQLFHHAQHPHPHLRLTPPPRFLETTSNTTAATTATAPNNHNHKSNVNGHFIFPSSPSSASMMLTMLPPDLLMMLNGNTHTSPGHGPGHGDGDGVCDGGPAWHASFVSDDVVMFVEGEAMVDGSVSRCAERYKSGGVWGGWLSVLWEGGNLSATTGAAPAGAGAGATVALLN